MLHVTIHERWGVLALMGKPSPCCWATEVTGYRVNAARAYPDGSFEPVSSVECDTREQAQKIARRMRRTHNGK